MSDPAPTTDSSETAATAIPDMTVEELNLFMDIYDCAKNNFQWSKVSAYIKENPKGLIRIPPGRRWTMLHQIVFCGNINHLKEALANQIENDQFNLLIKALDDKTIREVASERAHIHPQMMHYVERLVALDRMLMNARESKWDAVRQYLQQQPSAINEKPPYRKYYLPFYLALTGKLEVFEDLQTLCEVKYNLTVDGQKLNEFARAHSQDAFARYVEHVCPNIEELPEDTETSAPAAETADTSFPTPDFAEHPSAIFLSLFSSSMGDLFHPTIITTGHHHAEPETVPTTAAASAIIKPEISQEEQQKYDKMIIEKANQKSASFLVHILTCSITKSIMRDPVMAADGYTYERSAILKWFETSSRSPLTNQELANLEVLPNYIVNSIIQSLIENEDSSESIPEEDESKST